MAKVTGLHGIAVGKLGSTVYSVNSGMQIARAYQPNVANPSTEQQVSTRSRFKLASQLAAVMSPNIAIPKRGLVTARNQFVSATMPLITVVDNVATVDVAALKLTKSSVGLYDLVLARDAQDMLTMRLRQFVSPAIASRVVYAAYQILEDGNLSPAFSIVVTAPGDNGQYQTQQQLKAGARYVVYAYGVGDRTANASAKYGNYNIQTGEQMASLISSRVLSTADFTFTETVSAISEPNA